MSRQKYTIRLPDGTVQPFVLDVGRRRTLSLAFVENELRVRVPYGYSNKEINDLILSNSEWIISQKQKNSSRIGLPQTYAQGEKIRLLGKIYTISYRCSEKYFKPHLDEDELVTAVRPESTQSYKKAQVDAFINELAYKTITDCMNAMCQRVGLYPSKVTVKSMTSRWGSCSAKGNIAINYKTVQFPRECIEYVCVHELCHIKHMDHSKAFWAMVSLYCPDWKRLRSIMNE
ncbi:MAG: M48 family metallopeptidase [Ruminococcus sp.]|nr:M48 family metallopeptidase [Ruminococcus sp.]